METVEHRKIDKRGVETMDRGALNEQQRKDLRQLKVDVQKIDEDYVRVRNTY